MKRTLWRMAIFSCTPSANASRIAVSWLQGLRSSCLESEGMCCAWPRQQPLKRWFPLKIGFALFQPACAGLSFNDARRVSLTPAPAHHRSSCCEQHLARITLGIATTDTAVLAAREYSPAIIHSHVVMPYDVGHTCEITRACKCLHLEIKKSYDKSSDARSGHLHSLVCTMRTLLRHCAILHLLDTCVFPPL